MVVEEEKDDDGLLVLVVLTEESDNAVAIPRWRQILRAIWAMSSLAEAAAAAVSLARKAVERGALFDVNYFGGRNDRQSHSSSMSMWMMWKATSSPLYFGSSRRRQSPWLPLLLPSKLTMLTMTTAEH
jgi:hypothetical protein